MQKAEYSLQDLEMSGGAIIPLPQAYGTIVKPDTNPFAVEASSKRPCENDFSVKIISFLSYNNNCGKRRGNQPRLFPLTLTQS